ncbi:MAG TPA: biotin--[acetyl-CoA-carboxylase] ligase [Thermoanaerobaculia bacterium]|nr:biotin--[acetyl-CoA-carboxylase] ligase [Thermoanaerobaculia bacterium]
MIDVFGDPFDGKGYRRLANFVFFPSVDSTNAVARGLIDHSLVEEVELEPTVIAAAMQSEGRGRRDRSWRSPAGGVYATFVFRVPAGARLPHLPLAAGVWVSEALASAAGVESRLKWPNDVLAGDRKVAGILTEAKTRGDETHAAIGIGVNVCGAAQDFGEGATSAEAVASGAPSLSRVFAEICRACDRYLAAPEDARVVERWLERSRHEADAEIRVSPPEGGAPVVGRFAGLTEDGFLRLRVGGSEVVVTSGEVGSW